MSTETTTARAARREREERHKREVDGWRFVAYAIAVIAIATLAQDLINTSWRQDPAPCGHPVEVITKGYVDKKGNWRSFSNGEKIEVTAWKP